MIQMESILQSGDNSGARRLKCFKIPGGTNRRYATPGDIIIVSVREVLPGSKTKKGSVHRAVVVRTKKEVQRKDGTSIRFDENACVLVNKDNEPIGTRIFGPVAREIRHRGFIRIASLAPEVV